MQKPSAQNRDIATQIKAHLQEVPKRISSIKVNGEKIWIKRIERLGPVRRLQKGNPAHAFERERLALQTLGDLQMAAPRIIAQGPDWFAISDCGQSLLQIRAISSSPENQQLHIFAAAGRALADLHNAGLSHGRPNLKDICWDGESIRFLDFERFIPHRNTPKGHMQDVLMFVFNAHALARKTTPELVEAIKAYRATSSNDHWHSAQNWCRKWRWIIPLTNPIRWMSNSREFNAIPMTFKFILDRD